MCRLHAHTRADNEPERAKSLAELTGGSLITSCTESDLWFGYFSFCSERQGRQFLDKLKELGFYGHVGNKQRA